MEFLGKGAYAKVYRKGNKAVKITSSRASATRELVALETMQDSKHVIKLFDFYQCKKWFFIELELGKHTLDKVPFETRDEMLPKLFDFSLNVLRDLHSKECSHNDIKAANIIVTSRDEFKLVDFGVASFGFTKPSWSIFTPGIKPMEGYTPYADIWSMGITLIGFVMRRKTSTKFLEELPRSRSGIDVDALNLQIPKKYKNILKHMTLFKPRLRYKVLDI